MQEKKYGNNDLGYPPRSTQPGADKATVLAKIYMNNERQAGQVKSGNYQLHQQQMQRQ